VKRTGFAQGMALPLEVVSGGLPVPAPWLGAA